jgi:hypothetical protein
MLLKGGGMHKILGALVVASLLSINGRAVTADPFEDASAAYQRGDYQTARSLLQPLAERRDMYARFSLGLMMPRRRGESFPGAAAAEDARGPAFGDARERFAHAHVFYG